MEQAIHGEDRWLDDSKKRRSFVVLHEGVITFLQAAVKSEAIKGGILKDAV